MGSIPEELVQQFRTVAQDRLDRVEAAWASVLQSFDDSAATLAHRELHTLKGESKMLGFTDVNLVCHKLEDMLEAARARGYAVDEDFDLAVNMAIRFMAMLVRKKVGAQLGGIDLPGFIKQIDGILAEIRPEPKVRASTGAMQPLRAAPAAPRVPAAVRARLAPPAVDAFVEYAAARGARRDRLRASWHGLRDLIGIHRAVIGPAQLAKHKQGTQALARELGKQIQVMFDITSAEATAEALAAIDAAILHLVRNAADHGIEAPDVRVAAGKPAEGTIRVICGIQNDQLVATVSDDGAGVDVEAVRVRAVDAGLLPSSERDIGDRWFDFVCQPGFTTRAKVNEVSGRGVGLDVVRAGIVEVGGTLTATTTRGRGTTWRIAIPLQRMTFDAKVLRVPHVPFPIVLEAGWRAVDPVAGAPVIDIAHRLGLVDDAAKEPARYFERGGTVVAIIADRAPQDTSARRLIATAAPAYADVVVLEAVEGLLVHLDRMR